METKRLVWPLGVKRTSPTGLAVEVLLHDIESRGVPGMLTMQVSSSTSPAHPAVVRYLAETGTVVSTDAAEVVSREPAVSTQSVPLPRSPV